MRGQPQLKLCSCNGTVSLDAKTLASALNARAPLTVHSQLCRRELPTFQAAEGNTAQTECLIACTQEAALFAETAGQSERPVSLKFVNIRETAGWSAEGAQATPKIAALLALAQMPPPAPVPTVSYRSDGHLLIVGPAVRALPWADRLSAQLSISVLITDAQNAELPLTRSYPLWYGRAQSLNGYLGAFEFTWRQENPIDLDLCTRCNACIRACPEQAIDFSYQIDLARCNGHRACVTACAAIGAIDFDRSPQVKQERFDLVLDLNDEALIQFAHKPQGYFVPGDNPFDQALAVTSLLHLVGEFEKPKFFEYQANLCAHGRSKKKGCTNCIDVCSAGAIRSAGDKVQVEAHLCAGCGACSAVCPSGAIRYAYPRMSDLGTQIKKVLQVYHDTGGSEAALLLHNTEEGRAALGRLARHAKGLPARVIPLESFHIAAVGLDTLLGAIAYGVQEVFVIASTTERAEYGASLTAQMQIAETIVQGLGYSGRHFVMLAAEDMGELENSLWTVNRAVSVAKAATFNLSDDKRGTLQLIFDHLQRQAPQARTEIPLPAGAPYGAVQVDANKCTLCMACVGACPASALLDGRDKPALKFIERNCVQCNLCVKTCPENALSLQPRLSLTPTTRNEVVLHRGEAFHCVRCGNPFGTRQSVDTMLARLTSHPMFTGESALRRLQMCADCRVMDMMEKDPAMLRRQ